MTERADPGADPAVRAVVRQLVALLAAGRSHAGGEPGRCLLDVEIDGIRCCLSLVSVAGPSDPPPALSPREKEIARMVAAGQTNQSIARVLGISAWTVSTHLRRIFAKLEVNSRAAMVAAVLGWIPSHDPVTSVDATHVRAAREDVTTSGAGPAVPYR